MIFVAAGLVGLNGAFLVWQLDKPSHSYFWIGWDLALAVFFMAQCIAYAMREAAKP